MQIPLANIHWRFLLVRDDWGFQVNPLCRHDITSPFPPSGNEGYVRNRDVPPCGSVGPQSAQAHMHLHTQMLRPWRGYIVNVDCFCSI